MYLSDRDIYLLVIFFAVLIDLIIIDRWRKKGVRKAPASQPAKGQVADGQAADGQSADGRTAEGQEAQDTIWLFGAPSPALTALSRAFAPLWKKLSPILGPFLTVIFDAAIRLAGSISWGALLELTIIVGWAVWISSPLLNTPPTAVPYGGEFSNLTQTHFIWTLLPRCGLCFLWNGSINGGSPAFAELTGAVLHPLVFIPVLLWGVIQGAKVTVVAGLALAGIAQWRLARALKLGWWARMWSALLMVVGGQLTGKMENGGVALILGQACAGLVLAYGVHLLFNRSRRAIVGLAGALALLALSGEGYIQVAAGLTLLPTLALFCFSRSKEQPPAWKDYLLAIGLAALLAGLFLAPLIHFLPQMGKDADPGLGNYPPLEYLPLNLVIRDLNFHRSPILGKDPYLATHFIYIGWGPVLLTLLALRFTPARLTRLLWVFLTGILLVFAVTSLDLLKALQPIFPIINSLRHLTVASGLAVPFIMGLAAISLDELLGRLSRALAGLPGLVSWPELARGSAIGAPVALLMLPFIYLTLSPLYSLSQEFLGVRDIDYLRQHMQVLQTPSAEWINPPYGFYDWTPQVLARGLKISRTWRPWFWVNHLEPPAYISSVFLPDYDGETPLNGVVGSYGFSIHPEAEYAAIHPSGAGPVVPCRATSQGGWIDVDCPQVSSSPALLTVYENSWSGWYAWIDGKPAPLLPAQWLRLNAPTGAHHYTFRYLPWDAALGALLTLAGFGLSAWALAKVR